jgi:hypothetical protein
MSVTSEPGALLGVPAAATVWKDDPSHASSAAPMPSSEALKSSLPPGALHSSEGRARSDGFRRC